VLAVLEARGLELSEAERRAITDSKDGAQLDRWVKAALGCANVAELLRR
jgi:hypothetical protein